MSYKKVALLISSAAFIYAQDCPMAQEPLNVQECAQNECLERANQEIFNISDLFTSEKFKSFYDVLCAEEQAQCNEVLQKVSSAFGSLISNISCLFSNHKDLLALYKQHKNIETGTLSLKCGCEKRSPNENLLKEFNDTLSLSKQEELKQLVQDVVGHCEITSSLVNACTSEHKSLLERLNAHMNGDNTPITISLELDTEVMYTFTI